MTDAIIKPSDMHMQQRSIDYERQRHLANWLIESSPHMPKAAVQCQQLQNKKNKKIFTTSIFHDSFLFLSKFGPSASTNQIVEKDQILQSPTPIISQQQQQYSTNLTKSASAAFTSSQTNLPLQIVQSSRDGNKPKLRRFNSHDTSANMFSVADFENARLARRNELELVRQKQRYKMNSLSSGGCDSSTTGDSKGSKLSNESKLIKNETISAELFLDRHSLPQVARLVAPSKTFYDEKFNQASHSMTIATAMTKSKKSINHGHSSRQLVNLQQMTTGTITSSMTTNNHDISANNVNQHDEKKIATVTADTYNNGELFLLYRHLKKYKVYHAINAKSGTNRKKCIKIPQDFTGYFSLVSEKGTPTATLYTTMIQLVRDRVYKFLSVDNMQAYTESNSSGDNMNKTHYVKMTAKSGEVFRLLAVFEDGGQNNNNNGSSTKKDNLNSIGREKEKGRYVQLMSESRQIIYIALSTKGKFYEIEHSSVQYQQNMVSKCNSNSSQKSKHHQLNSDCVHRISNIINDETIFPINLKFISKHVNGLTNASIPENLKITKMSIENSVIACPIDETEFSNPLHLVKLYLFPNMKFVKSTMGFESDKVMFSNQNVQNLLKFCQFNCDNFMRAVEYEILAKENLTMKSNDNLSTTASKVKSKTSAFSKFFSSDKNSPAHEREDSIIFLSKNDLDQLNHENQEKIKIFRPKSNLKKKGWFKNLRSNSSSAGITNQDSDSKTNSFINSNSMNRYRDMSKMIQERFGTIENCENPSTMLKSSSEISYDLNERTNKAMQKCFSLQNIELNNSADIQPDLVSKHRIYSIDHGLAHADDKIENSLTYNNKILHSSNDSALDVKSSNFRQQSFITEKLFNEFYVKTKQYSKSSSNLHQLLHFSVPQKMNIRETGKRLKKVDDCSDCEENDKKYSSDEHTKSALMQLQLPPPPSTDPPSEEYENNRPTLEDSTSITTDELPYCFVRDSIVQAQVVEVLRETPTESIYAEISASCSTTPPFSNGSELSYNKIIEVPIKAIRNNNSNITRISFGQNIQTILPNGSAVKFN